MNRLLSRRDQLILALTLLVMLGVLALGAAYVVKVHRGAQERIAQIEPRYARLLGLQESADALRQAGEAARARLAQQVYPASLEAAQAGNDAQQRIRDVFNGAGLNILSTQVLPAKPEKNLDRVPLSVRAEGDLPALQSALSGLHGLSPGVFLQDFSVRNARGVSPGGLPRLAVDFSFFVVRARAA